MDITLNDMIELLGGVRNDIDYQREDSLVDGRVFDSFDILSVIAAIDDELDITVPAREIIPENFNSASALLAMVQRLSDED